MKKIPSLFVRDYENVITSAEITEVSITPAGYEASYRNVKKGRFLATHEVTPGCEWVINGEGIATRKWDGTACLIENGVLYKRFDAKHGKTPPDGFLPCQEPDPVTGHWPGWLKVKFVESKCSIQAVDNADKWLVEAYRNYLVSNGVHIIEDGTYEAVGPKIGGNKDGVYQHLLIRHGYQRCEDCPRDFEGIRAYLDSPPAIEGVVFHHPDGRMCKVKRTEFGLKW